MTPVQSAVPYGVPRGALIDLAPVVAGKIGRDRVVFAADDFDHVGDGSMDLYQLNTLAPVENPGRVQFDVTESHDGKPLDARITIAEGQKPVVEFLGRKIFFTELDRKGRADLPIAPGRYLFTVSSGGGLDVVNYP